jgi:hypothetical protein
LERRIKKKGKIAAEGVNFLLEPLYVDLFFCDESQ